MTRLVSVARICERLANSAKQHGHKTLFMWLKLAENQAYLNDFMAPSSADRRIGIYDLDLTNNLNYSNSVLTSFFGLDSRDAIDGHSIDRIYERLHPDDLSPFKDELQRSVKTGSFQLDYRIVLRGSVRWVKSEGECSFGHNGKPRRLLGSLIDITTDMPVDENVFAFPGRPKGRLS